MEKMESQITSHATSTTDRTATAEIPADSQYAGINFDIQDRRVLGNGVDPSTHLQLQFYARLRFDSDSGVGIRSDR